ncbi:unnamed protein product [Arabidopsis halleri]
MLSVSISPTLSYRSLLWHCFTLSIFQQIMKSSSFIFLKHCYLLISSRKILLNLIQLSWLLRFLPSPSLLQEVYSIEPDEPQCHSQSNEQ